MQENFFENINSESQAYFLGLMAADGTISKTTNQFALFLKEEDLSIIKKFKDSLYYHGKISKRVIGNSVQKGISPSSLKIKKDLQKLGIVSNKTKLLSFPKISKNWNRHFIRGYFDGDGTLSIYKQKDLKCNFTSGSLKILKDIKFLLREKNISSSIGNYNSYYRLFISGNNNSINFLSWIYNDSNFFLQRKKEKFFNLKDIIEKNVRRQPKNRPVIMINLNEEKINLFESAPAAEHATGIKYQNIRACCLGKQKTAGGYFWRYQ